MISIPQDWQMACRAVAQRRRMAGGKDQHAAWGWGIAG